MFFFYFYFKCFFILSFVSASFVGFKRRGKQLAWLYLGLSQQQYYLKKNLQSQTFFFFVARLALVTSWNRSKAKKKTKQKKPHQAPSKQTVYNGF